MTVREAIANEMERLSKIDEVVFLGENIINSGRIYGTMDKVNTNKCIEMPVAENLIAGCAIGLAIRGLIPVVVFQRMDFMLIASDAIINHACMMPKMTGIKLPIIFRTIKGDPDGKFHVGLQHSKDLSHVFQPYMPVYQNPDSALSDTIQYSLYSPQDQPILIVEDYKSFNNTLVSA